MPSGPARIRVAHVICTNAFAGAERYVATLSRALADSSCDVVVIGGSPARMTAELADSAVQWHPGATVWAAAAALARLGPIDIVHAHMTAAETAATLAWPFYRAPIVCTRHFAQRRGSSVPGRLVGRVLTMAMTRQLAISTFVASRVEGRTVVIRPGVLDVGDDLAAERQPWVLVAQRLEVEKRTDLAIEVWAESGLADRGWRLKIAGDGAERPALARLTEKLAVDRSVDFLGSRSDVPTLLAQASIFLAPRPDEPFGLSVVEAMAAGRPVVAARGGGHDETAGQVEGAAMFSAASPAAGGQLLAELAADEEKLRQYGQVLRDLQRAEFTIGRQAAETLAVYRSVLGR